LYTLSEFTVSAGEIPNSFYPHQANLVLHRPLSFRFLLQLHLVSGSIHMFYSSCCGSISNLFLPSLIPIRSSPSFLYFNNPLLLLPPFLYSYSPLLTLLLQFPLLTRFSPFPPFRFCRTFLTPYGPFPRGSLPPGSPRLSASRPLAAPFLNWSAPGAARNGFPSGGSRPTLGHLLPARRYTPQLLHPSFSSGPVLSSLRNGPKRFSAARAPTGPRGPTRPPHPETGRHSGFDSRWGLPPAFCRPVSSTGPLAHGSPSPGRSSRSPGRDLLAPGPPLSSNPGAPPGAVRFLSLVGRAWPAAV